MQCQVQIQNNWHNILGLAFVRATVVGRDAERNTERNAERNTERNAERNTERNAERNTVLAGDPKEIRLLCNTIRNNGYKR